MNTKANAIGPHYGQGPVLLCNAQLYLTAIMTWNDDVAYAMTPFKLLTLPLGVWPLQKYNTFALIRSIISGSSLVRYQFSYYNFFVFQKNFSGKISRMLIYYVRYIMFNFK